MRLPVSTALITLTALVTAGSDALAQPGVPPQPPLVACGSAAAGGVEVLCGAKSPEDLELTPDGKSLIVAQYANFRNPGERVGIALFELASKTFSPMTITVEPNKSWGDATCPGPVGEQFAAHGTSLAKRVDGAWQYFVVNHGGRQSIEMFELKQTAGTWGLIWRGCVVAEKDYNDVAALANGGFIATHPTGLQAQGQAITFDGKPTGWLARWTPGKGEEELPGTRFGYPNGVVATADGRTAYFASWTAKEIHKYNLREGKDLAATKLDFMPDNLTWTQRGQLLAAGIKGTRGNCPETGKMPCIMGFGLAQMDTNNLKVAKAFDSGERALISGVSVALQVGPAVYVGSFQGDRMVKVDWKQ